MNWEPRVWYALGDKCEMGLVVVGLHKGKWYGWIQGTNPMYFMTKEAAERYCVKEATERGFIKEAN